MRLRAPRRNHPPGVAIRHSSQFVLSSIAFTALLILVLTRMGSLQDDEPPAGGGVTLTAIFSIILWIIWTAGIKPKVLLGTEAITVINWTHATCIPHTAIQQIRIAKTVQIVLRDGPVIEPAIGLATPLTGPFNHRHQHRIARALFDNAGPLPRGLLDDAVPSPVSRLKLDLWVLALLVVIIGTSAVLH